MPSRPTTTVSSTRRSGARFGSSATSFPCHNRGSNRPEGPQRRVSDVPLVRLLENSVGNALRGVPYSRFVEHDPVGNGLRPIPKTEYTLSTPAGTECHGGHSLQSYSGSVWARLIRRALGQDAGAASERRRDPGREGRGAAPTTGSAPRPDRRRGNVPYPPSACPVKWRRCLERRQAMASIGERGA